ncbi:hypothetical protein I7636_02265 [Mycoplasma mycoides subsp. capri]|nr:hypothetical protein I7636_02265 [Mycoplasma mycoides subsp. capri]
MDETESKNNNTIGGLWHYRITLKDYIEPKFDSNGIQKVDSPIDKILGVTNYKPGTTIHKYVWIDHSFTDDVPQPNNKPENIDETSKKYSTDFLGLDKFKSLQNPNNGRNWKFKDFWQTSQAKHFIGYYANLGITTDNLKQLDYEQLVYLWKKYVTEVLQKGSYESIVGIKQELQKINDLNLKLIKNKTEVVNKIKQHILDQVKELTDDRVNIDDLDIKVENNSLLKELNENNIPSSFVNFDNSPENKKLIVKVGASDLSTILKKDKVQIFTVTNSLYDLTSLNNFLFFDINVNFDKLDEQDITKFITSSVSNQINSKYNKSLLLNKTTSEDITLTLGKDYQFFLAKKEESEQELNQKIKNKLSFSSQNIRNFFKKNNNSSYRIVAYALDKSQYISSSNKNWFINDDKRFSTPNINNQQLDIKELFKKTNLGLIYKPKYQQISSAEIMNKLIELNKEYLKELGYDKYSATQFLNELEIVKVQEEKTSSNRYLRNYTFDLISKRNSQNFKGTLTVRFQSPNDTNIVDKIKIDDIFIHNTIVKLKEIPTEADVNYFWQNIVDYFKETISRLTHKPEQNGFNIILNKIKNKQYVVSITAKNENEHFTGTTNINFIEDSSIDEVIKPELPDEDKSPKPGYDNFSPDGSDSSRDNDSTNRRDENKPGNNSGDNSSRNPDSRTPGSSSNRDNSSSNNNGTNDSRSNNENGTSSNPANSSNEDQPGDYVSPYKPGNGSRTDSGASTDEINNKNNGENTQGDENKPGNNSGDNSSRNPDSGTPDSNSNRDGSSSNSNGTNDSRSGNENGTSSNPTNSSNEDQPGDYVSPYKPGNGFPNNGTNTEDKWWEKEDEIVQPTPSPKKPENEIKPEDKWILGLTKKDRNWIIAAGVLTLGIGWVISYFWWRRRKLIKKNKVIKTTNKKKKDKKLK